MTIHKANALPHNVISLPTEGYDSLKAAMNQFVLWEVRSRDCIKVKRCYIDVAQDLEAGVLLSQIIYWHLPNKEGEQKLTVQRDAHWWLAKGREDWWQECRLTPKQFDRAIRQLEAQQLVCTKVYKWQGQNTKHIRVDWSSLLQALSVLGASSDAVVGFRRREAVNSTSKIRDKETQQDSPGFPNSQSYELSELPNSQSCKSPNSQSLDSLIGDSRIPNPGNSELTNREIHLYTEITIPKTTGKDYNTPPLNPPRNEQMGEGVSSEVAEVEVLESSPIDSSQERPEQLPSSQPVSSGRGDYSSAANSACGKFEQGLKERSRFAGCASLSHLPAYRTTWERDGIKSDFLNWMCLHVMASWTQYKQKTPTPYDAKNWVRNREKEGCHDLVENRYDQMLHEQANPQAAQIINTQNAVKSAQGYESIMQGLQLAKTGGIFR